MQTSALITLIKEDHPEFARDRILTYLDEIQKMVFTQKPTRQMRIIDTATGTDRKFTSTSGTYAYDIDTDNSFSENAWRVTAVYTDSIDSPTTATFYDATPNASAKIVFKDDPSGSVFYYRAYKFPTTLSAESIQLDIPHAYHITHVLEGVEGLIEKSKNGESRRWENFLRVLMPDLISKMSEGPNMSFKTNYKRGGY